MYSENDDDGQHTFLSDQCSVLVSSSDVSSDSNSTYLNYSEIEERALSDEIFIESLLQFMEVAAPKDVFSPDKSRRRKKRRISNYVPKEKESLIRHYEEA